MPRLTLVMRRDSTDRGSLGDFVPDSFIRQRLTEKGESAMAFVSGFTRIKKGSPRVHTGQTICGYMVFEDNGQTYVQLETYAGGDKQDLDRPKQLLQVDRNQAAQLLRVLREAFPDL